jgi:hypothetical protein
MIYGMWFNSSGGGGGGATQIGDLLEQTGQRVSYRTGDAVMLHALQTS